MIVEVYVPAAALAGTYSYQPIGWAAVPPMVIYPRPVSVTEMMLPFVTKVPLSGSVREPAVKVVAEVVTCHPAPLPVATLTMYYWSAALVSTTICFTATLSEPTGRR
ncbi:hypothetical protein [Nonomuraea sp. B19D2]|uniref:hypothetical protein n=1 Tax=Nonomuraea sp. B19D2 TaxID=3159561 RepID=UPI0032DB84FA